MRYDGDGMWRLNEQMRGVFRRQNKMQFYYNMGGKREGRVKDVSWVSYLQRYVNDGTTYLYLCLYHLCMYVYTCMYLSLQKN